MSAFLGDQSLFPSSVLIVPSISHANLPQLTADLLIASLSLSRIGVLGDGSVVAPMLGQSDAGGLTSGGLEVYGRQGVKAIVVQQRAPVLPSQTQAYLSLLQSFFLSHPFSALLLLTSVDVSSAASESAIFSPIRSLVPPSITTPPFSIPGLLKIPAYLEDAPSEPYPPALPSGGLARRFLRALESSRGSKEKEMDKEVGCLAMWCVEGDNRSDATGLSKAVLFALGIDDIRIREPVSWEGLLGGLGTQGGVGLDSDIYG